MHVQKNKTRVTRIGANAYFTSYIRLKHVMTSA